MYFARANLHMTEKEFWRCTPRKLYSFIFALYVGKEEKPKQVFIDEILP